MTNAVTVSQYLATLSPDDRAEIGRVRRVIRQHLPRYAALAVQKNYRYKASGHKLDMGKSCVRFRSADDLPLDLIGETISATTVNDFIAQYQGVRDATKSSGRKKKGTKKR